jgi:predicted MFS family arabinose efflux permease
MWEFIAFWAWVGVFAAVSYSNHMDPEGARSLGKLTGFLCILAAAPACVWGGLFADRIGKGRVAAGALAISGSAAVLSALTFGGPVWLTFLLLVVWGAAVVPDSPQFSALVADFAPPELAGSILTFQAALGFTMTTFTVQMAPLVAGGFGWPVLLVLLALGPVFGLIAMRPVLHHRDMPQDQGS